MRIPRSDFAVGIFALVVIVISAFMTVKISDFSFGAKKGYRLFVNFKNIAGLDIKTKIRVAGVDVGTIEKIELVGGYAKITLRMYPDIALYNDTSAIIRASGLLGDKYLALEPGNKEPFLKNGDQIKIVKEMVNMDDLVVDLSKVALDISNLSNELSKTFKDEKYRKIVEDTLINLRDITKNIKGTVAENDTKVTRILDRIDSISATLDAMIKENRPAVSNAISNVNQFSAALKEQGPTIMSNLNNSIAELKEMIAETRPAIKETTQEVRDFIAESKPAIRSIRDYTNNTMINISNITSQVAGGHGSLGRLLKDDSLYYTITNAVGGIDRAISTIDRFKTFISFQGEYLLRDLEGKGTFSVTLMPRPDKYYILGVTQDPVGNVKETVTSTNGVLVTEKKVDHSALEFTVQFARRFSDTAVRIGLTESTFGVGIDQFIFKDKLKLTADAWDFSKAEYKAVNPHVKTGITYNMFKNVFVTGGVDNIFNPDRVTVYVGGGITFEDEDFKYLMGSMPSIPR